MSKWNKGTDQMDRINALYDSPAPRLPVNPLELTVVEGENGNGIVVTQYGALWSSGPLWACEVDARRINSHFAKNFIDTGRVEGLDH